MNHYRKVATAAWDEWATREADPDLGVEPGPLTAEELLQRGVVVVGQDASWVYLAAACHGDPQPGQFPGHAITCPRTAQGLPGRREAALPASVRPRVLRARVWRAGGRDIREQAPEAIREHVEERRARGLTSRFTAHEVPQHQVEDTDAVELAELPPVRWAGE